MELGSVILVDPFPPEILHDSTIPRPGSGCSGLCQPEPWKPLRTWSCWGIPHPGLPWMKPSQRCAHCPHQPVLLSGRHFPAHPGCFGKPSTAGKCWSGKGLFTSNTTLRKGKEPWHLPGWIFKHSGETSLILTPIPLWIRSVSPQFLQGCSSLPVGFLTQTQLLFCWELCFHNSKNNPAFRNLLNLWQCSLISRENCRNQQPNTPY